MRLAGHIAELSWDFKIYPPKEVTDDPSVLKSDQVLAKLSDTKWWLQFADGTEEMLSFAELLVLTYQLIQLRRSLTSCAGRDRCRAAIFRSPLAYRSMKFCNRSMRRTC